GGRTGKSGAAQHRYGAAVAATDRCSDLICVNARQWVIAQNQWCAPTPIASADGAAPTDNVRGVPLMSQSQEDFNGKTAIVTGGASGIGAAIVRELAGKGASVVIADYNRDGAE